MKKLFTKLLPFLVAFCSGICLYVLTDKYITNSGLNNLLINVASGLVSIPLVFIFYDVINQITSRKLHNTLFESVSVDINNQLTLLINIICELLQMEPPKNISELDDFLELENNEIYQKLNLIKADSDSLRDIKKELTNIIHKPVTFEILSEKQIAALLNIVKEITFLIKNLNSTPDKKGKHKKIISLNLEYIIENMMVWIENGKKEALRNHGRFSLSEINKES
ncbi:MAG: hypothetical protein J6V53_01185 [Alphaproteobacteria bacterium]|nr:hypothetical protein [Alphaproteobacteria bacterium]